MLVSYNTDYEFNESLIHLFIMKAIWKYSMHLHLKSVYIHYRKIIQKIQ